MDQTRSTGGTIPDRLRAAIPVGSSDEVGLIDAQDTVDGDYPAADSDARRGSPTLRTQEPRKSFFSFLRSVEWPEDTLVKFEAKRIDPYLPKLIELEQKLRKILRDLQELNRALLGTTTDDENQTELKTAADNVRLDSASLTLDSQTRARVDSGPQATNAHPNRRKLQGSMSETSIADLSNQTPIRPRPAQHRSKTVEEQNHHRAKVNPVVVHNIDGSDHIVSSSEGDAESEAE